VTEIAASETTTTIVVAVNAGRRCARTLELAASLATNAGADLEVVFVEDADLLRLADLPVTFEIDRISGMSRKMDARSMLRALRCEVQQVHREIARLGRNTSLRARVRVVRGHYLTEALAASAHGGVTFVHGARRPLPGDFLPATPAPSMAPAMTMGVAWAHRGSERLAARRPLWTLFDGSPASVRALKVALLLSRGVPGKLMVLLPGRGGDETEGRKREAQALAGAAHLQFLDVGQDWLSQLRRALAPGADSLLVLARKSPALDDSDARSYLETLSIPVVLVT
jgi:hypothetical protein